MKQLLFSLSFILLCSHAYSQDTTITLSSLAAPDVPVLSLLDLNTSTITTVHSTKAFTASALQAFANSSSAIPQNYAVEFTPYWFVAPTNRTALKYMGVNKGKLNPFNGIKKALFSVAFVNSQSDTSGNQVSNVAMGASARILAIYPKGYKKQLQEAYGATKMQLQTLYQAQVAAGATDDLADANLKLYESIVDSVTLAYERKDSVTSLSAVLQTKPILSLDGSVAYDLYAPDNNLSGAKTGRFGAWLTLTYSQNLNEAQTNYLHLSAYARYLENGASDIEVAAFQFDRATDIGGKVELEMNKLKVGYEFIHRNTSDFITFRSAGLIQYQLNSTVQSI